MGLKLTLKGGGDLARTNSTTSLRGRLGVATSAEDSAALERLQRGKSISVSSRVAELERQEAEQRAELERIGPQKMFERKMEEVIKEYRARLAVVMDFTASTTDDIKIFIANLERIQDELKSRFAELQILPVVSGGDGVRVGALNDFSFLRSARNVGYDGWESPIGPGMRAVVNSDFFPTKAGNSRLNALVYFSDDYFIEGRDYHELTVPSLKRAGVLVGGLVSKPHRNSDNRSTYKPTHEQSIVKQFGEKGVVVFRDRTDMDPVEVIIEFLMNEAQNRAKPVAAQRMPKKQVVAPKMTQSLRFADHLSLQGRHAGQVLQGSAPKLLTG